MLWRRPLRAHPPIVAVVKWTFAAARISCASDRVIQSAGDGIAQSAAGAGVLSAGLAGFDAPSSFDAVFVAAAGSGALLLPSDEPSSPLFEDDAERAVACRSFLAQPEPLKWTVGA